MARRNGGAAGIDGVTFAAIEETGLETFLDSIRDELVSRTYQPAGNRRVEIPKDGGRSAFSEYPPFGTAWYRGR